MKPHVKIGLIVGSIGLVTSAVVSFAVGLLGPGIALVIGAVAGALAARGSRVSRRDGVRAGVVAAAIAGLFAAAGQVIGGLGAVAFIRARQLSTFIGKVPGPAASGALVTGYYIGALIAGAVLATVGFGLAVLAGWLAGYLSAPRELPPGPNPTLPPGGPS